MQSQLQLPDVELRCLLHTFINISARVPTKNKGEELKLKHNLRDK